MARSGGDDNTVIWLHPKRGCSRDGRSFAAGLAAFLAFVLAIFFVAEFVAQAIIAWLGHDRGFALNFFSASNYL
jgi:hypothetical protein